jgi:hypothetical protein
MSCSIQLHAVAILPVGRDNSACSDSRRSSPNGRKAAFSRRQRRCPGRAAAGVGGDYSRVGMSSRRDSVTMYRPPCNLLASGAKSDDVKVEFWPPRVSWSVSVFHRRTAVVVAVTGRSPVKPGIPVGLEEDPRHFPHGHDDHWPLWDAMRGADTWPVSQQTTRANQVDRFKRGVPEFIDQAARKEEISMAVGGGGGSAGENRWVDTGHWTLDRLERDGRNP